MMYMYVIVCVCVCVCDENGEGEEREERREREVRCLCGFLSLKAYCLFWYVIVHVYLTCHVSNQTLVELTLPILKVHTFRLLTTLFVPMPVPHTH